MRVIRAINPERALRLPADEWQAPALNDPLGTSGRPKTAIYLHRHTYLRVMETVAGRALLPPDLSEMAAHRVTQAEVIAFLPQHHRAFQCTENLGASHLAQNRSRQNPEVHSAGKSARDGAPAMTFQAPVKDLLFNIANIAPWSGEPAYDLEIAAAVLEEFGRFCVEEIAPLNASGDRAGSRCEGGQVHTPSGFPQAYAKFMAMGWQGLVHPSEYGGQDLPRAVGAAAGEIINAANMSFALCPLLTDGVIEALRHFGSPQMQQTYLPKLVSGVWTGTMNLTEPQAGSDLALLRTRAERQADGSYHITGTKIFITYGEHDLSENIIHLVLARTPDAPKGIKGISLFLVPKRLVEGSTPNAVRCQSIEHKLGVRASPTCVLAFEGATGFLIGRENAGLE